MKHIDDTFLLSEHFYSPQCEGYTTGVSAYFIRVAGCNLSCGVSRDKVREIKRAPKGTFELEDVDDLRQEGKATWVCDSVLEWLHGERIHFDALADEWEELGIKDWVGDQIVHLIFTGGEPTTLRNQYTYVKFLQHLQERYGESFIPYTEIETNGTQVLTDDFFARIQQINCSPKLSNSGMPKERRIVPDAIKRIMEHPNYWFKFVVSGEDSVQEYIKEYVEPFNIPHKKVLMMPAEENVDNFHENTRMVLELTKKYGFRGMQRMHISAWDRTTGV